MTNQQAEEKRQQLIDRVIYNIKKDIENGDTTAIDALLSFCPTKNLVDFLPEEECDEFFELEQYNS
jgi:hypothetical protein